MDASRECCGSLLKIVSTKPEGELVLGRGSGAVGRGKTISKVASSFQLVTDGKTIERYAREIAKAVLFALRCSILVLLSQERTATPKHPNSNTLLPKDRYGIDDRSRILQGIKERCGALLDFIPSDIYEAALTYVKSISRRPEFVFTSGAEPQCAESVGAASEKNQCKYPLHRLLRSILLYTIEDSFQTNKLLIRHFIAVHAVHNPNSASTPQYSKKRASYRLSLRRCCTGRVQLGSGIVIIAKRMKKRYASIAPSHTRKMPLQRLLAYKRMDLFAL